MESTRLTADTPVHSSNVAAVGFDRESQTMMIQFKNGKAYLYHEVPEQTYNNLLNTESVGKFLSRNIYKKFPYSMPVKAEEGGDEDGKTD